MIFKRKTIDDDIEKIPLREKNPNLYNMLPIVGDIQIYNDCRLAFPTDTKAGARDGIMLIATKYLVIGEILCCNLFGIRRLPASYSALERFFFSQVS